MQSNILNSLGIDPGIIVIAMMGIMVFVLLYMVRVSMKLTRFMKKYRHLIQNGIFYRLKSPFEGTDAAWMVVSPDQKTALAAYFRMVQPVNAGYSRIRLQGLHPQYLYRISDREYSCYGDELMNAGLILSDYANGVRSSKVPQGDGQARIFLLTAEDGI